MNDVALIEKFFSINFADTFISLIVIILFALCIKAVIEKFCSQFKIETWWMRNQREKDEIFGAIGVLKSQREIDVKESIAHDKRIQESVNELSKTTLSIQDKLNQMDAESKQNKLAEYKERIGQSYRYYHSKKEWNSMEEEALRDLVSRYEANGGVNSFVHETVVPESYTWKKVDNK